MTSNHRRMLQGLLGLAVVLSAAGVRAQDLETPGSKASSAPAAAAPSGPSGFGDGGQLVLSAENLFGFTYNHSSNTNAKPTYTTYSLFTNPFGVEATTYQWPRLAFDAFVTKGISAGGAISFSRTTASAGNNSASLNAFQVAPRIGYAMMVAPALAVWARGGVTYIYNDSNNNFLALTIDALGAIIASPHLAITVGPTLDVALTGKPVKYTSVGLYFGLAIAI